MFTDIAEHLEEANSPYRNFTGCKKQKLSLLDFLPAKRIKYCIHYGQGKITNTEKYHLGHDAVYSGTVSFFFLVGWDLRHQVLRPLLAYCTAPNNR
jgi:hypothetical protein